MIVNKLEPFYTDQEREDLRKYDRQTLKALKEKAIAEDEQQETRRQELIDRITDIGLARDIISSAVETRYIEHFAGDDEAIIADAWDIVENVEKSDYLGYQARRTESFAFLAAAIPTEEQTEQQRHLNTTLSEMSAVSYENCKTYILSLLRLQLKACAYYDSASAQDRIIALVEAKSRGFFPPQVKYNPGAEVKTITDKFAGIFFSPTAPQSRSIPGQRVFLPVKYEGRGKGKEITLFYDFSFKEEIIKRFGLPKIFDDQMFFVASIIDNLYDEGNTVVSLTKIWHELGNSGSPSTKALTQIVNMLRLGMSTIVTADISEIDKAWNIAKPGRTHEIISPVIPVQIAQEKFAVNGQTTDAAINITGHTPFYLIGYPIKHYTTWNKDVLRLYQGRRTERYYSVLRFLITQIGWMRNKKSKRSDKILYSALYERVGDKSTRGKQLTRDMLYKLLDEVFIPAGYISAYKEDNSGGKPGVKLTCAKGAALPAGKQQ